MAKLSAGTRKRPDGTLEKRFTVDGKRYSVYGKTQKEISDKEFEIREQIKAGLYTANRNITLDKYFEEWIKQKTNTTAEVTLLTYKNYYRNHISPEMGKKRVQQIERREVQQLQDKLLKDLSVNSADATMQILKSVLNGAVVDEIITKNPAKGVKSKRDSQIATETYHRALTVEEQQYLMNEIKNDYLYELVALLLCTGMRSGEACALTWRDIDFKNNVIHVNKTMTIDAKGTYIVGNTTKTKSGKRDIPINENIKKVLLMQREKMGNIINISTAGNVFLTSYGCAVRNVAINRAITNALKRLESKGVHIEHFTAHALRDTFATRYIEQGGQPQTLKTILGHSSLSMTMDLYAHVLPNTRQQEMNAINIAI